MITRRQIFFNERVRAMIFLFIIMGVTIIVVFFGIEVLKQIPTLSPQQQLYLAQFKYPAFFKITVIVLWGIIALLSAYLVLLYRYLGFFERFCNFCEELSNHDHGKILGFRKNENSVVMEKSFNNLLSYYRSEMKENEKKLLALKTKLKK